MPEQALDGLGIGCEDKPSEFSCNVHVHAIKLLLFSIPTWIEALWHYMYVHVQYMYMHVDGHKVITFNYRLTWIQNRPKRQSVRYCLAGQEGSHGLATNCQPSDVGEVQRRRLDGSRITIPCPQVIILYNKFMGGVDNGDQLMGYYECVESGAGSFTNTSTTSSLMSLSQTASFCWSILEDRRRWAWRSFA